MRGVMEKCTYCIQRIQAARIAARRAGRPADCRRRDSNRLPAVCPTGAITFGDLNDPASRVSRLQRKRGLRAAGCGTEHQAADPYLARIRNPAPG